MTMLEIVIGILWLICSVAVFVIYHTIFDVVYFDLGNGCLKEIVISAIVGAILAGAIYLYWYIAIPLIILVIYIIYKNNS